MKDTPDRTTKYQADSLSLIGAVALGTGVMIGAGIFALTGQMAEMTGSLFSRAFLSAARIVLGGFLCVKAASDPVFLIVAAAIMAAILITEFVFLRKRPSEGQPDQKHSG